MIYTKIFHWSKRKLNQRSRAKGYAPRFLEYPKNLLLYDSSWRGLESVIADLIQRFEIPTDSCLEFGTEYGYSTVALSNYFSQVIGVDLFTGDVHAGIHKDNYAEMTAKLRAWPNIHLIQADYRDYIRTHSEHHGLTHVDIVHTLAETLECGLWAAQHSKCTILHDTESYPEVKEACRRIARGTGKQFYNYDKFFGLGIIV